MDRILSCRSFSVYVSNGSSKARFCPVSNSVPHDSVLGPLVFIIFLRCISQSWLSVDVKIKLLILSCILYCNMMVFRSGHSLKCSLSNHTGIASLTANCSKLQGSCGCRAMIGYPLLLKISNFFVLKLFVSFWHHYCYKAVPLFSEFI